MLATVEAKAQGHERQRVVDERYAEGEPSTLLHQGEAPFYLRKRLKRSTPKQ
jgi:hypothetical protein